MIFDYLKEQHRLQASTITQTLVNKEKYFVTKTLVILVAIQLMTLNFYNFTDKNEMFNQLKYFYRTGPSILVFL